MTRIDPDDPKWTAYVLDELDAGEHAAVELELNASQEARGLVEELRVAAAMMKTELHSSVAVEPLTDQQRNTILAAAEPLGRKRRNYRAQWLWITGFSGAAAAIIAVFVIIGEKPPAPRGSEVAVTSQSVVQGNATAPSLAGSTSPALQTSAKDIRSKRPPQQKQAQSAVRNAQLFGEIHDATTAVIPGASVEAKNKDTGETNTTVTDGTGRYALDGLEPGKYDITASLPGFRTDVQRNVQLDGDAQKRKDVTLQVAQAAETVEVTRFMLASAAKAQDQKSSKDGAAAKEATLPLAPPARALMAAGAASVGNQPAVTASSYPSVRGFINQNMLPPLTTVRIEGMVNYFTYDYPQPTGNDVLTASIESATAPWNEQHRLVRIGIQSIEKSAQNRMAGVLARNVAVALEFDSTTVRDYRFIGSEEAPRPIANFNVGQSLTFLYEIVPAAKNVGALTVKVTYEDPISNETRSLVFRYIDSGKSFADSSSDLRFAAAVASFGMILSDSPYKGAATFESVRRIVVGSMGTDSNGMRREFLQLVQRAAQLQH